MGYGIEYQGEGRCGIHHWKGSRGRDVVGFIYRPIGLFFRRCSKQV